MNILHVKSIEVSKISAQPHPTLCIQFLNRENNDKVVSGDFCRFCSFYHRCYSVIRRRCQTINHCSHILQLIPQLVAKISSSSRHNNFSSLEHTNTLSLISSLKICVPALTNEPAINQLQRALAARAAEIFFGITF